ncbi:phosphoribosyltransferase family protein [Gilvibacter sp.]|uniref:phosphoribosyltransferase family protein n=1 Tax=Gilvibacter sp. TaxID=2729997 RepID=UPI0025C531F9|nr:phosphoribosyltransferase family protein [Gilvibacter sp.]NQX76321.1 phosphoribosyl transferase [Gilvibacter sp.]
MNYRSIKDLNEIILKRLSIIPRDIDLIVGVPRSGMLPANLLALYLNRPYTDIDSFLKGHVYKAGARGQFINIDAIKKVLVVDDSIASGGALREVKERLKDQAEKFKIEYAAIYVAAGKERDADYYFETVPTPRYFQWNIFNHTSLSKACFDIDGVLCVDPTPDQNDDGEKYRSFILNAAPLYLPGSKIGTLVTSRLEKYREETEVWLEKHGVQYDKLVMLDLPDAKARQRLNNHGQHKANEFSESQYSLFVESELPQALEINRITKKPVFCTETFSMVYDSQSLLYNIKSGRHLPILRKVALKLRDIIKGKKSTSLVPSSKSFSAKQF